MRIAPGAQGGKAPYGFLFGTGVVHGFLAEYYRHGEPTPLVAAKTLARGIGSAVVGGEMIRRMARPSAGAVELDGRHERGPSATTSPSPRGRSRTSACNFRPFYRYAERPGHSTSSASTPRPLSFVRELPRIHRGQPDAPRQGVRGALRAA